MFYKLTILLLFSCVFGAIINVPDDYGSIQSGIDAAIDGDTVVVYPGLYEENILIDKSITLTSLALFDTTTNTILETLENWYDDYGSGIFEVTSEYINTTIIDGSGELKSTITIASEEDLCIEPIILGFTIQDGSGTLMDRFYEDPDGDTFTIQQYMGGGILSYLANPTLHYNKIQNNGGIEDVIKSGSAIYPASSSDDIDFIDRNTQRNSHCENAVFDFTHNFFENNFSSLGRHIGNRYFNGDIDLSNCVFDYWNCQDEGVYQTPIWVNIDDLDNLIAEDEDYTSCLLTGDVYIDPVAGDDDLNDGLSWESPFYTIQNTFPKVVGTEQNPINFNLAEGTFSPSTNGEYIPIELISNVNFIGLGKEVTIIDAEQTDRVITIENCENNIISHLTITGGSPIFGGPEKGGGVYCSNSSPLLKDVIVAENSADVYGGGIYMEYSQMNLTNVIINNNGFYGGGSIGGGIYMYSSIPIFRNVEISNNIGGSGGFGGGAGFGGGIASIESTPILINVTIVDNSTYGSGPETGSGGGIWGSGISLNNSIIRNNSPNQLDGGGNITYSNIQGGWTGEGNIDADPIFIGDGNYHLMENSPCIDSGDPDLDNDGEDYNTDYDDQDPDSTRMDMGAYYYNQNSNANFTATPLSGSYPLTVTFTDLSQGNISSWQWDYDNDGIIDSNEQNPTYTYNIPGIFSVSLLIIENNGANYTETKLNYINVFGLNVHNISQGIDYLTIQESLNDAIGGDTIYVDSGVYFENLNWPATNSIKLICSTDFNCIIDGNLIGRVISIENNVIDTTTIIKGFKIQNGYSVGGGSDMYGGGIYLNNTSPKFRNIIITENWATYGGGVYCNNNSSPIFKNVEIIGNYCHFYSIGGWEGYGGGLYLNDSSPILINVLITNNLVGYDNSFGYGGGLYLTNSTPSLVNVLISDNSAIGRQHHQTSWGGGIYCETSILNLTNVTITENFAYHGSGLDCSGFLIENSIIWNNTIDGSGNISYSNIHGGWDGIGNINAEPLFIDSENWEYNLQAGSPCIDTGTADTDGDGIEDITDYCGTAPDMGAFEYCECGVELADVNGDGDVNVLDLVQIVNFILYTDVPPYECATDYNEDGEVNILDLVQIVNYILGIG